MQTSIWINGYYREIKPDSPVNTFKNLRSFCAENLLPHNIVKSQGGYYIIREDYTMRKVFHALSDVTYQDIYDFLK